MFIMLIYKILALIIMTKLRILSIRFNSNSRQFNLLFNKHVITRDNRKNRQNKNHINITGTTYIFVCVRADLFLSSI